jgi:hypothetical protein
MDICSRKEKKKEPYTETIYIALGICATMK